MSRTSGSRARIRTSVERTKTACPAWLDDPGLLRRKLYPERGGEAAAARRRLRSQGRPPEGRKTNQARPMVAGPGERVTVGQAAGLPCIMAEWPRLVSAASEVGELLMM